jgi:Guanyl-specific ribonuclease Sa
MKTLKISLAFLFTAFLVACSTPTVSDDESDEVELTSSSKSSSSSKKEKSSSSKKEESSSSSKKVSSSSRQMETSSSIALKSIYEAVEESGLYTTKDSVAAYLCKFDKLPGNYVGKDEGISLYESKPGNTFSKWNFNPWTTIGVMIGGDVFENREGLLPNGSYHEADVDYSAKNRGTKRLIYQSDCVIYYTADHYETFNKLEVQVP